MKAPTSFICTSTASCVDQHSYSTVWNVTEQSLFLFTSLGILSHTVLRKHGANRSAKKPLFLSNKEQMASRPLLKMSEPVVRHTAHLNSSFSVMCILTSLFVQTDQSHKRKKYPLVLSILPIVREKVCDFFGVILYNFHVCSLTWPVKDIDAEGCSVRCSEASIKYLFTKLHL